MDNTILKVLTKVSEDKGIPLDRLKEFWSFNNRAIFNVIKEHGNPDSVLNEIKIPYIGTLNFNEKRYDKIKEMVNLSKENKLEGGHDVLGDTTLHREDNL